MLNENLMIKLQFLYKQNGKVFHENILNVLFIEREKINTIIFSLPDCQSKEENRHSLWNYIFFKFNFKDI